MRVKEALAEAAAGQAIRYLEGCRFQILDRDWRHDDEIASIIAADSRTLVIIDLRVRAGTRHGVPLDVISEARTKTLRGLTARWLAEHGRRADRIRMDVVGLLHAEGGFTTPSTSGRWADDRAHPNRRADRHRRAPGHRAAW
jgi:putative endonuclease